MKNDELLEVSFHLEGGLRLLGRESSAVEPALARKAFEPTALEERTLLELIGIGKQSTLS